MFEKYFFSHELPKLMRQNDEEEFELIETLEETRNARAVTVDNEARLSDEANAILHNKFVPGFPNEVFPLISEFLESSPNSMCICFRNEYANAYNLYELYKLCSKNKYLSDDEYLETFEEFERNHIDMFDNEIIIDADDDMPIRNGDIGENNNALEEENVDNNINAEIDNENDIEEMEDNVDPNRLNEEMENQNELADIEDMPEDLNELLQRNDPVVQLNENRAADMVGNDMDHNELLDDVNNFIVPPFDIVQQNQERRSIFDELYELVNGNEEESTNETDAIREEIMEFPTDPLDDPVELIRADNNPRRIREPREYENNAVMLDEDIQEDENIGQNANQEEEEQINENFDFNEIPNIDGLFNTVVVREHVYVMTLKGKFFVRKIEAYQANRNNAFDFVDQGSSMKSRFAIQEEINLFKSLIRSKHNRERCIVPFDLKVAVNAKVMLLKNLDVKKKLINGKRGVIESFERGYDDEINTIHIKFMGIDESVAITRTVCHSLIIGSGKKVDFWQFPIKLAWATTAHKAQGQTLDKVAIHIGESCFAHGAMYVALSRVRSINDLLLFGLPEWPGEGLTFHVNSFIRDQMDDIDNLDNSDNLDDIESE